MSKVTSLLHALTSHSSSLFTFTRQSAALRYRYLCSRSEAFFVDASGENIKTFSLRSYTAFCDVIEIGLQALENGSPKYESKIKELKGINTDKPVSE